LDVAVREIREFSSASYAKGSTLRPVQKETIFIEAVKDTEHTRFVLLSINFPLLNHVAHRRREERRKGYRVNLGLPD
jgi:hypothetical protein